LSSYYHLINRFFSGNVLKRGVVKPLLLLVMMKTGAFGSKWEHLGGKL